MGEWEGSWCRSNLDLAVWRCVTEGNYELLPRLERTRVQNVVFFLERFDGNTVLYGNAGKCVTTPDKVNCRFRCWRKRWCRRRGQWGRGGREDGRWPGRGRKRGSRLGHRCRRRNEGYDLPASRQKNQCRYCSCCSQNRLSCLPGKRIHFYRHPQHFVAWSPLFLEEAGWQTTRVFGLLFAKGAEVRNHILKLGALDEIPEPRVSCRSRICVIISQRLSVADKFTVGYTNLENANGLKADRHIGAE